MYVQKTLPFLFKLTVYIMINYYNFMLSEIYCNLLLSLLLVLFMRSIFESEKIDSRFTLCLLIYFEF